MAGISFLVQEMKILLHIHGLLKSSSLPRTVVPSVCNMGKRVLPTVQALSEERNASGEGGEVDRVTPRNKDLKALEHDQGIRGE